MKMTKADSTAAYAAFEVDKDRRAALDARANAVFEALGLDVRSKGAVIVVTDAMVEAFEAFTLGVDK